MVSDSDQLLIARTEKITCPSCDSEFTLNDGFAKKALEQIAASSSSAIAELRQAERATAEALAGQRALELERMAGSELQAMKARLDEQNQRHAESLAQRDAQFKAVQDREHALELKERDMDAGIKRAAAQQAAELVAADKTHYEERLAAKDTQLNALRGQEVALRKQQAALQDERNEMELNVQRKADTLVQQREAAVRSQEQERAGLKEAELLKTISDMRSQLVEAQRKADQGSQQLQGEVLEIQIEEGLRQAFPLDIIEEVKKGQRGGDVLQRVVTRTGQPAGSMLWETKRAKDWSTQWIPKLKEDMRAVGAVVGILVTMPEAVPKDWPVAASFALRDDVWVTHPACALGLAEALRVGLTDVHRQRQVSAGKNEKMEALYDYLTSPQFAQKLTALFDTFKRMKDELESERNLTTQRWARRDKQLQIGLAQLLGIGGEIQGLSQQDLPVLELEPPPSGDDDD